MRAKRSKGQLSVSQIYPTKSTLKIYNLELSAMLKCNVTVRLTKRDKQKSQLTATTYKLPLHLAHGPVDFL